MKKQSSIEWLLFEQRKVYSKFARGEYSVREYQKEIEKLNNKAKEMHKQEIIEAREDGFDSTYAEYGETPKCYLDGSSEEYYINTYEKEN